MQSILNQLSERFDMIFGVTGGCRGTDRSSNIGEVLLRVLSMLKSVSKSWLSVQPGSSILGFLLSPGDGGIFILLQLSNDLLKWEWTEAFNSEDSDIIFIIISSGSLKFIINLSGTKNDLSNLLWSNSLGVAINDQGVESGVFRKFVNVRAGTLKSQKLLRGDDY